MPDAYDLCSPLPFLTERPHCSKCHGRMMLARIEIVAGGVELRTFECPRCEHVEKMPVEDPMKSSSASWINGA